MDTEPTPPPVANEDAVRRVSLESLLVFLDNNDASCPECGYSLCGIKSANCPECGWVITLCPNDGIDRRRVIQQTRWLAYVGLIISVPSLFQSIVTVVRVGAIIMTSWWWFVYLASNLLLLTISVTILIRLNHRTRTLPTIALLRETKRISITMLTVIAIAFIVPFTLSMAYQLLSWLQLQM